MSTSKLMPLRGMKDLLPHTYQIHQSIIQSARKIGELYNYQGFDTPILENASVFDRTLGQDSDILNKELYAFSDKKGRLIAMRPEFTASIIRAIFSNNLLPKLPLKLFSTGPLFRYDRPQEGRQRQFHQLNFEYIATKTATKLAYYDAEIIEMAAHLLKELAIITDVKLELNSLGCDQSRKSYQVALTAYFARYFNELSADSQKRLTKKNPLRILDSKDITDQKIIADSPVITDYYTKAAQEYFEQVKYYLHMLNIDFTENNRLVRGLDYYSHTAFEFTTDKLGTQATILAGGRYDQLAQLIGGTPLPAIGFAAGIERIALMRNISFEKSRPCYIIPIDSDSDHEAIKLAKSLRQQQITTDILFHGKISKRLQQAVNDQAKYTIFIGEEERSLQQCRLKNLDDKTEITIYISELAKFLLQA